MKTNLPQPKFIPGGWINESVLSEDGQPLDICLNYPTPDLGSPVIIAHVEERDPDNKKDFTKKQYRDTARFIADAPELGNLLLCWLKAYKECTCDQDLFERSKPLLSKHYINLPEWLGNGE